MTSYLLTGCCLGAGAVLLSLMGNPANSGICVSCFLENTAGALGLHGDIRMQYIRPELIGFVLGAFAIALGRGELRAHSSGTFLLRFFVGLVLMVGCAVFMGCPIKMLLRLGAGDLTALVGLAGLIAGVFVGLKFVEGGFRLGKGAPVPSGNAFLVPGFMAALLLLLVLQPDFIAVSVKGSGAQRAPVLLSLSVGLLVGVLAQRTGFCVTAGIARVFLWGPRELPGCPSSVRMLAGLGMALLSALLVSLMTGQFELGVVGQPSSNESYGWAFLGMLAVGFGSILIRGCPFRQLVLAGSGDVDAGGAVLGMLVGAALVQSWDLAGNAAGTPLYGQLAVLVGLVFLFAVGALFRARTWAPRVL